MTCKKHTSCLVVHTDGKCPDYNPNAECTCQKTTLPNQPIPSWEEEFDLKFGGTLETVHVNSGVLKHFIRQLLSEEKSKSYQAGYNSSKADYHTEWREEAKREIEALKPDFTKMVHDLKGQCDHERLVTIHKVASLPFLQPPKDTV